MQNLKDLSGIIAIAHAKRKPNYSKKGPHPLQGWSILVAGTIALLNVN